jgi:hypothetical protein
MAATVRDLINGAARLLGVLATGETLAASEQQEAFYALNDMIDTWSNENLLIYSKVIETFPLIGGQGLYTMGSGGNFNTARAQKIENATIQVTGPNPAIEVPMKIITLSEWSETALKSTSSSIPMWLYRDGAYPLDNLNFWPVPTLAYNVVLYSWKQLAEFVTVNDSVLLPPGYKKLIRYGLAIEMAPEFGKQLDPTVATQFENTKEAIKRMNVTDHLMKTDAAIMGPKSGFNWLIGE